MKNEYLEELLSKSLEPKEASEILNERVKKKAAHKKSMTVCKRVAACFAAAAICFTAAANSGYFVASAMYKVPVVGSLAKIVTFRTYEDEKNYFYAHIEIPEAKGLGNATDKLNKGIDDYLKGFIDMYESDKAATDARDAHYAITSTYDVVTDNDDWFSVGINTTLVMAGGTEYTKNFTVDKHSEKVVALSDLFKDGYDYKKEIYDRISTQMRAQMAKDEGVTYFLDDDFGFTKINGDENFYINPVGELVVTFNEYDVAPGVMGKVEFNLGKLEDGKLL